jgi:hypothetical protein
MYGMIAKFTRLNYQGVDLNDDFEIDLNAMLQCNNNTDNADQSHNKKTSLAFPVLIAFVLLFVGNKWRRLFKNSNNLR